MSYVIAAPDIVSLPVQDSDQHFPVRRVYCVGQNYADHAREMGSDPDRQAPFFFCKARESVLHGADFPYPGASSDVQFEIELVVALKSGGKNLAVETALEHVYGYAVGLDMTRRDLQGQAKKTGRPWEAGKAFDHSAPCSTIVPASQIGHLSQAAIWLEVNGERRQSGDLNQMIWNVPEILAQLSTLFELCPGDLIFTGTPSGVGPITKGDHLRGAVDGLAQLDLRVV